MRSAILLAIFVLVLLGGSGLAANRTSSEQSELIARGRYLVAFGACNECHTPGWRESDGNLPVSKWMIGSATGFRGPWGTVYPANVRQRFYQVSETQWLAMVDTRAGHPPMTWQDLRMLNARDRRAIYVFIRSLGQAGPPSLPSVPAEREPTTPYFTIATPAPAK